MIRSDSKTPSKVKQKNKHPRCFGELETVFPMGKHGLRETPESCRLCFCKTRCLRAAMEKSGGLKVREETLDRAYEAGMITFWQRWSKKKDIRRRMKDMKKGGS